ncbi:MAG: sigma factor-like helix-turn-helix DNA-binding protein [Patescibacteria group bacterium]|jgi:hypothetical protein
MNTVNIENKDKGELFSSSILDKIISSKEDQEKSEFNPGEVIAQLLKKLNQKEADVLKRRFGLCDFPEETLEIIGKRYEVTRERIRQIESLGVRKIVEDKNFNISIRPVEHVLSNLFSQYGGIMEEEYMLSQLFITNHNQSDEQAVIFTLGELLDKRFFYVQSSAKYRSGWRLHLTSLDFVDQTIEQLIAIIAKENKPVTLENLFTAFSQTEFFKQHSAQLNEKSVESYLEISQQISKNPFNEYGLVNWGSIIPKRMNDKIYIIMKKEGKPMHFTEIASKITSVFKKKAYPPTVHNELILNDKYVLVGRGIYALKEWGYKEGVVADVLVNILKAQQKPMGRDELLQEVLKQRIVKKNTIYLALTNKNKFKKLADGRYIIAPEQVQ